MEDFVNFLLHYYREILLGLSVVLEIVILIVKRCKKNKYIWQSPADFYKKILELVQDAEETYGPGHGYEKMEFVIEEYFRYNVSDEPDIVLDFIENCIRQAVEKILNTPTKKGGPGRDEEA